MNSFGQWLSMGGYAQYVWPAYGIVGSVLLFHVVGIKLQKKRRLSQLRQWLKKDQ